MNISETKFTNLKIESKSTISNHKINHKVNKSSSKWNQISKSLTNSKNITLSKQNQIQVKVKVDRKQKFLQ